MAWLDLKGGQESWNQVLGNGYQNLYSRCGKASLILVAVARASGSPGARAQLESLSNSLTRNSAGGIWEIVLTTVKAKATDVPLPYPRPEGVSVQPPVNSCKLKTEEIKISGLVEDAVTDNILVGEGTMGATVKYEEVYLRAYSDGWSIEIQLVPFLWRY